MAIFSSITENIAPEAWYMRVIDQTGRVLAQQCMTRETLLFPSRPREDEKEDQAETFYESIRREKRVL